MSAVLPATPPATKGDPTSLRRTARLGGALYLLTFAASIPAVAVLAPILGDPAYVLGDGTDARVTLGSLLDVTNAVACVGTAVVLYPVVRRQSGTLALGFVASRILEAATILVGVLSLLAVLTLRQEAAATGADPGTLVAVATALIAVRDWSFAFIPFFAVATALLLGTLMYRSRLVPRVIPVMGLVGAPLLLAASLATLFGANDQFSALSLLALPGIFFWELSLGVYLVAKGFRPSAITTGSVSGSAALATPIPAGVGRQ